VLLAVRGALRHHGRVRRSWLVVVPAVISATVGLAADPWDDAEDVMYDQPELVERQNASLLRGRPGIVDLYFVGFAADAEQDVFRKEAVYARRLVDERFGTRGRSALLVNSEKTKTELPLASVTNLETTLRHVASLMDADEDVLFLFLTSHGDKDGVLVVEAGPLPLYQVTAEDLADLLRESGIRWKVVLVNSCYSGAFLEPLRDERTLVVTASAKDRRSFGCSDTAEKTYFGRAFLEYGLASTFSFPEAFAEAVSRIRGWEKKERLAPSKPQMFAPVPIVEKLDALAAQLAARRPSGP
jgi:hypothetical protein